MITSNGYNIEDAFSTFKTKTKEVAAEVIVNVYDDDKLIVSIVRLFVFFSSSLTLIFSRVFFKHQFNPKCSFQSFSNLQASQHFVDTVHQNDFLDAKKNLR